MIGEVLIIIIENFGIFLVDKNIELLLGSILGEILLFVVW